MSKNSTHIEDDIKQLEAHIAWFEGDEFNLEEALSKYQEAEKMAEEITRKLRELKNTITKATEQ